MIKSIKLRVIFALLIAFPVFTGWAVCQQEQEVLPEANVVIGNQGQNIPVDLFDSIIYLEVMVNKMPLTFVLDTGAGAMSAIDVDAANRLKLPLQNRQVVPAGAGEESVEMYDVKDITFSLPSIEILNLSLVGLPLSTRMDPYWGKKKEGLLGGNVLSRLVTVIDYVSGRVHFYEPSSFNYFGNGEKLPFTLMGLIPMVQVKLYLPGQTQPVEGQFLVDTGARTSILAAPFVKEHQILEKLPEKIKTTVGYGIGGETRGWVGRVDKLGLGGITFNKPLLAFSQDSNGALASEAFAGIIGADILHRFTVIFDYSRKQMILQKNTFFDEPFEFDMSGMLLKAEGNAFTDFKVFRISENSPAALAGLMEGDRILSINEKPASWLTLEQIGILCRTNGQKIQLKIQRGDTLLPVTLILKRRI